MRWPAWWRKGELEFRPEWIDRNKLAVIEAACASLDLRRLERLKPLKDALPPEITYEEIRLVVARLRREQQSQTESRDSASITAAI